jgi:hypothetical protein
MKSLFTILIFFILLLDISSQAYGGSMFERKIKSGQLLFDALISQGVSYEALNLTFQLFDYNEGDIPNTKFAVIVDYSMTSTMKRLYLLDLTTGVVRRFYVSHGINTGVLQGRRFANISGSWKSSLGFYYAKGTYQSSKNGLTLLLDGIDRSNSKARSRAIVFHGADYVTEDFIYDNNRLGWSEGCFSVPPDSTSYLIRLLQNGSIIFAYHRDLLAYARQYPEEQHLTGREIVPSNVNLKRTKLEGGYYYDGPLPFMWPEPPHLISPLDFYF